MTDFPNVNKLTPRDRAILRDVIATYILSGEPVSSRSIAKHSDHGLSPASIRNVMADLEDLGFLSHPHVSAGRVPTEEGYHFYIESLMPNAKLSSRDRESIDECLNDADAHPERLVDSASHTLSELSKQIGIVLTPSIDETVVKAVNFLPLSGRKILCIVVSANGFIDNKVIETQNPLPQSELIRISNYLTERFAGRTLQGIRDRLLELMAEERAQVDELLSNAMDLAAQALRTEHSPEIHFDGTRSLLNYPELADLDRVRALLDTFADKADLVRLLNQMTEGPGVRVVIGGDSDLTSKLGFSLVTATYGMGRSKGAVGIFGPSRMEYQRVIPLVEYLSERLGMALEKVYAAEFTH